MGQIDGVDGKPSGKERSQQERPKKKGFNPCQHPGRQKRSVPWNMEHIFLRDKWKVILSRVNRDGNGNILPNQDPANGCDWEEHAASG